MILARQMSTYFYVTNSNTPNASVDGRGWWDIYYEQSDADKALNRTKVTIQHKVQHVGTGLAGGITVSYNFNSAGFTSVGTSYPSSGAGWYTISTTVHYVTHNSEGVGSFTLQGKINDFDVTRFTNFETIYLPTIPRASTVTSTATSGANKEFGQEITFAITRASTSFTHTLDYVSGGTTYTIGTGLTTSASYTFSEDLIANYPTSASPTITVTCRTYNGGTLIGTKTTTVYLKVPTSYVPTCSLALSDDNSITSTWGIWVKSQSILRGVITAEGVSGSTISSYLSTLESENRSGTPFTKTLQTSGSVEVISTATDTRGRTASDSEEITVVDYTAPTLVSISVKRCTSDGTLDEFGTYGKVVCEYSISSCDDNNAKSLVVNLGETVKIFTLSTYSGTYTATDLFSGLAIDTTYNLTFKLKDSFFDATTSDKTVSQVYSVLPSFVLESDHNGGDGKCLGRIATRAGFDVHLDTVFFNNLKKDISGTEHKVLDESDIVQTLTTDTDKVPSSNAVLETMAPKENPIFTGQLLAPNLATAKGTQSCGTGIATTFYTPPTGPGVYLVSTFYSANEANNPYGCFAIISVDGTTRSKIMVSNFGTSSSMSVSNTSFRVQQNSGITLNMQWSVLRLI